MKSWYSWLSTALSNNFSFIPMILVIPALLLSGSNEYRWDVILPANPPYMTYNRLILVVVIYIALLVSIAFIHGLLFPLAGFEIGQGIKKCKSQRTWRIIIGGIIVSLIVGIIVTRIG
jgi:hypothetical protein